MRPYRAYTPDQAFLLPPTLADWLSEDSPGVLPAGRPREARPEALAFIVGPFGATLAAAISIRAGYLILGGLFAGMAVLANLAIREPSYEAHSPSRTP